MSNDAELPDDVPDVETLALAAHEIAHGWMAATLGHNVDSANLCKSWWSGQVTNGYMRWSAPDECDVDTWADSDTMVCLAGLEGGAHVAAHFQGWSLEYAREHMLPSADHDMQAVKWLKKRTTRSRRDLEREMQKTIRKGWESGKLLELSVKLAKRDKVKGKAIEAAA